MPELTTIQLGTDALGFDDEGLSELIMRSVFTKMKWWIDLPKLTSLTAEEQMSFSLYGPRSITLEGCYIILSSQADMPSLTAVTLNKEYAFKEKKTVHTKSFISSSPSLLDITPALQEYLQFIVSFRRYF